MASTRYQICERILRAVYGEQPSDDSNVTVNLVNAWLMDGVALAAKQNYKENIQIDSIAYANNSFYTTFKGIAITQYEDFVFQLTLPQLPLGMGRNEAVSTLQFVDANGAVSDPAIPLSQAQVGYAQHMRPIPNKTLYYPEGQFLYMISVLQLFNYTGKVRMISAGDSTDINSVLNVPDDYMPVVIKYCSDMLRQERAQPKALTNSGVDIV
jgi:hypothetical protein